MVRKADNLNVMLCVPGRLFPGDKNIIAKVKEGNRLAQFFTFGNSHSLNTIYERAPMLYKHPLCKSGWRKEA